ncbi:cytochrome c oxidase subunit 4 [Cellulomonas aerilata]|uniref:Cytochrome c oxidase polypeptide 4 n=1 Tax=Cellulomonas aerilata TaxID=515326 RepID=A0A512DB77_9CELL|nr:cytochrome c oxidase subunit 4 [Cellulomonas aerilata]GEO33723.1 putative cytochrome c oxidase polypeptide 4 [Cellulomonas aerilata]
MRTESKTFLYLVPFFIFIGVGYGFWSGWEPVGSLGILLVAGLALMIGAYFAVLARRIDARPEDNPEGNIEEGAGDQGVYSPWSWWPLAIASAAALVFLGMAVGWWMVYVGAALGMIALVGWVFEFSRGQHAH